MTVYPRPGSRSFNGIMFTLTKLGLRSNTMFTLNDLDKYADRWMPEL